MSDLDLDLSSPAWRATGPLWTTGAAAVIAGGIAAAVTGPTGWERGSWVAAFAVLVLGAAQIGLAAGQAMLTPTPTSASTIRAEWVLWNVGGAAVIGATLGGVPGLVTLAGIPLAAAIVMALSATRDARRSALAATYRGLLGVVLLSIPVGIALSWIRN